MWTRVRQYEGNFTFFINVENIGRVDLLHFVTRGVMKERRAGDCPVVCYSVRIYYSVRFSIHRVFKPKISHSYNKYGTGERERKRGGRVL